MGDWLPAFALCLDAGDVVRAEGHPDIERGALVAAVHLDTDPRSDHFGHVTITTDDGATVRLGPSVSVEVRVAS